jgi:hypothetical protein
MRRKDTLKNTGKGAEDKMARVKYQKARKDYPAAGIKKGDMYYYARIKTGPRSSREIRQLKPIRQSQLTTSDFMSQFYGLQERLSDYDGGIADLSGFLEELAADARNLAEEEQAKYDNMPEPFQQGDTGQLIEERAQAMEAWADSLESAASTAGDKASEYEENGKAWDEFDTDLENYDPDEEDAEEPEEPDEERMDEADLIQDVLGEIEEPSL